MAKTKPNKLKYIKEYDKKNRKQILIKLNKETDSDIIGILDYVSKCGLSKQGYIKSLIREDHKRMST